ncbi:MAG TPA: carboxymuconolactone decarboxylase family protein [Methylophilus sp.]|uniref:carboxymuconolactone decarboxylase family protein n=1 Tax=Methylophilus sp. TaxID=29541 RepID=UPI002BA633E0|nr:carboxymuconolactone decarboxylase family protein [Methylophilus sp.]HSH88329.1 carboxymuconolactone decarboxylase family protein [Methylophilus sp.]
MARIQTIKRETASADVNATLDTVKAKLGKVPNLIATFAQAPAALHAYLGLSEAVTKGRLTAKQRESLALAIGQANSCQYCLSAHSLIARGAGLNTEAIQAARHAESGDALTEALLKLAVKIVQQRGVLSDQDFMEAQLAGVDDGLILEVIANVSLNTLTNYTNHIAQTEIDFPVVEV